MYEPKLIPNLSKKTIPLTEMRYGIKKVNSFVDLEDPMIDPLHIHSYLEIFFNVSDEVSFLINDSVYSVAAGDVVISRPNDVHMCIFPSSSLYDYYCLWIDADFSLPFFDFLNESDFSPLLSPRSEKVADLKVLFSTLNTLQYDQKFAVRELTLLLCVLSNLSEVRAENKRVAPLPIVLAKIIRYINHDLCALEGVGEIAKKFFVSPATLNRFFRLHLHTTPGKYIEAQRLALSIELLKGGASVTEACAGAGFSDCSHFIVLFKKKFGVTPLQYKKHWQLLK